MPILIIWGVLPIDSGDQMDPYSHGVLTYDPSFDVSTEASQIWLLNFCKNLKKQKFFRVIPGPQLLNCFIENFVRWMEIRRCHDPIKKINVSPCCNTTIFPFSQNVFELCLVIYMKEISETPKEYISSSYLGGPKFIQNQSRVLIVEFLSNSSFSYNYYEIDSFYQSLEHWFKDQLKNAPKEMSSGFFISYLGFYDLQRSLASDTLSSVFFSITFASIILLLITGNILINILCTLTILATMQTLLGFLVLINWRLNILESLALSSSVGLTVDFSMHYSISYILSDNQNSNRFISGKRSLLQMIGPTTMACITTAAPGFSMLPSQIQPYIQISTFLIITIILSWIYSTFLFGSVLLCFGPEHDCGKINYVNLIFGKRKTNHNRIEQDQVEITLLKSQQQMISRRHSYPLTPHSKLNHLEYKRPKSYFY